MKKFLLIFVSILCITSCADIKEDIADLQNRVDTLEVQLEALQQAHENDKIIKEIKPFQSEDKAGWTIVFKDESTITVYDMADVVAPMLAVNAQGYWEASYDKGETYNLVLDADGNPISSQGASVRVVTGEDGTFVIETYNESEPDKVLSSIQTPYSSNPATGIASIVKDALLGTIKLVMADGTEYMFNLDVAYPTSIVVLTDRIYMPKNASTTFMFRVNPSNAVVDLNLDKENPMFELDMANSNLTRSYVSASTNYVLEKIEEVKNPNGEVLKGQYRAFIKDLGTSDEYCEGATLVVNSKDAKGEPIQISSDMIRLMTPDKPQFTLFSINDSFAERLEKDLITVRLPYGTDVTALKPDFVVSEGKVFVNGTEVKPFDPVDFSAPVKFAITHESGREFIYTVTISYSDLPVVYINTKNGAPIKSKETWLKGTEIYITNAGEHTKLYTEAQIRGRGNTTWGFAKKPYAIKLDSKESVLGMPKHKRWVLLANYLDKTHIRNSIAFEIARRSEGLDWTPRGQHVDVVLNGVFNGTYYLCEQIKVDENRVNITEMEPTDIDEESITGGYLLELDKNMDEAYCFWSPVKTEPAGHYPLPYMLKEPEEFDPEGLQKAWIYNHIAEVETALWGEGKTTEDYLEYIDLDSFIDYWFVYELTGTGEPTHPRSVYMWKERGEKIHAGPVWDFDYYTYQMTYKNSLINMNCVWNSRIINDPNNRPVIKERWMAHRDKYRSILEEIDRQYEKVRESALYNDTIWPLVEYDFNREYSMSCDDALNRIKSYYQIKFDYMDSYISAF